MRLISFALTKAQILAHSKTVTRRMGWTKAKAGDRLQACGKVMGRKRSDGTVEPLERLAEIEITSVSREMLACLTTTDYGPAELTAEGFPGHDPAEWITWFCTAHKGCTPHTFVTRLEFKYV